jgi:thiol:disulfide interchange protein
MSHFLTRYRPLVGYIAVLVGLLLSSWTQAQSSLASYTQQQSEFFPVDEAYQLDVVSGNDGQATLGWIIAPDYYLYRHAFKVKARDQDEPLEAELTIPDGLAKTDEFFGDVEVYYQFADLGLDLETDKAVELVELAVTYQGCADAGLCYPPRTKTFLWHLESGEVKAGSLSPVTVADSSSKAPDMSVLAALLFALLGGLILNIMPCVFPVLSLKALSFTQGDRSAHQRDSLIYAAGVVTSFVVIAAVLIAIQQTGQLIGWGFQLQSTGFVIGLAYLFTAMGLSLNGVIQLGSSWMNIGQSLTEKDGAAGSFFTGVLAVVVASPCTAPFMGSALGYALTQPLHITLIIFAFLGLGMALPMVLLSYSGTVARLLPRPGAWMETAKQVLAFPLYLTAVWLLWVAGSQSGINTMASALAGLVVLALALYLYGDSFRNKVLTAVLLAVAIFLGIPSNDTGRDKALDDGQVAWSAPALSDLRARGEPVFVDVTADWCITCLANEAAVLFTPSMKTAFAEADIPYMIADWTDYDPAIGEFVQSHGRSGIPLYVMYPSGVSSEPIILPQLLTQNMVLEAIEMARR